MSNYDLDENSEISRSAAPEPELIPAELVAERAREELPVGPVMRRRFWLPFGLFVATCASTLLVGGLPEAVAAVGALGTAEGLRYGLIRGLWYAIPVMTILICHEAGHFLQARRYRVYTSFPYFIPMPITPLGTLGAVIVMDSRMGHRRALFDIGITGPLAGLIPTLLFCIIGLQWSHIVPGKDVFGDPFLFKQLAIWLKGPIAEGSVIQVHPLAFAGWVGLLLTSINLMPIGQLDGGHILYGLLRSKARTVATLLLLAAIGAVFWYKLWGWSLMLMLLMVMGPAHPPTADDRVPLGAGRILLGWLTLAFIPIGFTPTPFLFGQ